MSKRSYTHIQEMAPEIKRMLSEGMTQREVAEHFGLKDKRIIKSLMYRERVKEQKMLHGISPRPKGRPRKNSVSRDLIAEQAYEIERLRMENKLLRDFLQSTGRM